MSFYENKKRRELFYDLVGAISKNADEEIPKKHGKYLICRVGGGSYFELDTWSKAINFIMKNEGRKYYGMDFGGFSLYVDDTTILFWIYTIYLLKSGVVHRNILEKIEGVLNFNREDD